MTSDTWSSPAVFGRLDDDIAAVRAHAYAVE
jgi:hypothetical protein